MSTMSASISDAVNSPIVVALMTISAGFIGAVMMGVVRIIVRLARIETKFSALNDTVMRALEDKDIMRWSTLNGAHVHVGDGRGEKGGDVN